MKTQHASTCNWFRATVCTGAAENVIMVKKNIKN